MKGKWLGPLLSTLLFIFVILLFVAHIYLQTGGFCLTQWAQSEQSGHVSESLSALFSGLAFAGLIVAVFLQKEELGLQRKELEQTREELRGQKEQLQIQNRTLKHQRFESSFFQLLRLHSEIVDSMEVGIGMGKTQSGRKCFGKMYEDLRSLYTGVKQRNPLQVEEEFITHSCSAFYQIHRANIGHYFRALYNIVKFVDRSDVEDKKFYTNLIRAQLSSNELLLLFYNCLGGPGKEDFKPFIEKYSLLKGIPERLLDESHRNLYTKEAFGEPA